ncbi:MAG: hypothetical protein K6346_02840 [Halothiobacillaceae bacterium]
MQNQQAPQPPQPLDPRIIPAYYRDDEISLVDLWITIARRKKLVLGVAGAVLLIGLAAALVMPKKYDYSAVIEIGGKLQRRDGVITFTAIESPDTVKSKLESAYLPDAIRKHLGEAGTADFIPRFKVQAPKGSNTLIISSTAPEERGDAIKAIMQDTAQALIKDHDRVTAIDIAQLQNELSDVQYALDTLSDPDTRSARTKAKEKAVDESRASLLSLESERKLIEGDLSRLDRKEEMLKGQLLDVDTLIKKINQQRSKGALDSWAQMVIDNQLQQLLTRQADLEERLHVQLAAERDNLRKRLEDNTREITLTKALVEQHEAELAAFIKDLDRQTLAQENRVKSIKVAMDNIHATRLILEPVQANEPAGPRKALILALAGFLGLFAGLFAAFIAEFRDKVLERMAEQGEESASA